MQQIYPKISASFLSTSKKDLKNSLLFVYYTKNNYLKHRNIQTFEDLVTQVDRAVKLYNTEKPHIKLARKTPFEFEKSYLCVGQKSDGEKSTTE